MQSIKQRLQKVGSEKKMFDKMYNSFGPFEEGFKKLDWNETLSTDNLEAASECLMVTINKIKGEFSKNVTFSRKKQNLPWLNGQLWKLMK